ncbi:MAG: ABC transporter permease [Methanomicrobiales archaeon]|nr:ABC transporter permease [Methanomicrobiales archaeon]MDD1655725.1 ABC transporter permease [Methanomicrobiales archaeon]
MTYLYWVAAFGTAVVYFLWLRDVRIFRRTGLPGYRKAAYRGVLYAALALLGLGIALSPAWEALGIGVVLLALFLQGREAKERIWTTETTAQRLLGSVERMKDKPPERDQ